jgi:hypothetical protein
VTSDVQEIDGTISGVAYLARLHKTGVLGPGGEVTSGSIADRPLRRSRCRSVHPTHLDADNRWLRARFSTKTQASQLRTRPSDQSGRSRDCDVAAVDDCTIRSRVLASFAIFGGEIDGGSKDLEHLPRSRHWVGAASRLVGCKAAEARFVQSSVSHRTR